MDGWRTKSGSPAPLGDRPSPKAVAGAERKRRPSPERTRNKGESTNKQHRGLAEKPGPFLVCQACCTSWR